MSARDDHPIMLRTIVAGYDESELGWLIEEMDGALNDIDAYRAELGELRTDNARLARCLRQHADLTDPQVSTTLDLHDEVTR